MHTAPPELIDIGANLAHASFDEDRAAVIDRAADAGVTKMVVTGSDVAASVAAAELAAAHPGRLFATAGIHPHHAGELGPGSIEALRGLLDAPGVVAVGECGLDHFRNFSTPAQQREAFVAQLELAAETGLPVFLHQRDAQEDFIELVSQYRDRLSRAVAHCFTSEREHLQHCLDLDLHIGITGWICDERRGHHLRELVSLIPPDRLMIETDAPYLLPRDLRPRPRSRRNEPMYLAHIVEVVAGCVGRDVDTVAAETTATACAFFGLPDPAGPVPPDHEGGHNGVL